MPPRWSLKRDEAERRLDGQCVPREKEKREKREKKSGSPRERRFHGGIIGLYVGPR